IPKQSITIKIILEDLENVCEGDDGPDVNAILLQSSLNEAPTIRITLLLRMSTKKNTKNLLDVSYKIIANMIKGETEEFIRPSYQSHFTKRKSRYTKRTSKE
ncbi:hypothetical protein J0S82_019745, partial [Galemys pyrenaicus]